MMMKTMALSAATAFVLSGCAPTATSTDGIAVGLSWRVSGIDGGAEAALFEANGRRTATIRCRARRLLVDVPAFTPLIGPTPQFAYLHLGGSPIMLSQSIEGETAGGEIPANFGDRVRTATEFRVTLGQQVIGPHIPPTGPEGEAFASACTRAAQAS